MDNFKKILMLSLPLLLSFSIAAAVPIPKGALYSMSEVSKHSQPESCWMVIDKKVLDVTKYRSEHPAPKGILEKYCGKDATEAYADKGGLGEPHAKKSHELLPTYQIGTLKD
jgi:cytochrome b involved in lipid metabolism